MRLKNTKIGMRLGLGFGAVTTIIIISAVISAIVLNTIHSQSTKVGEENQNAILANEMAFFTIKIMNLFLYASTTHKLEGFKQAEELAGVFKIKQAQLKKSYGNDENRLKELDALLTAFDRYYDLGKEMAYVYLTEGIEEGQLLVADFDQSAQILTARMKTLQTEKIAEARKGMLRVASSADHVKTLLFWMNGLAVLISILVSIVITFSIVRPIKTVVSGLAEIAAGEADLTRRLTIEGRDEMSELATCFNQFTHKLQMIIKDFRENAQLIIHASDELAHLSLQMAANADSMAQKSSNVATAAEQMLASIGSIAQSSDEMSAYTQSVSSTTEEMSQSMGAVATAVEEMDTSMHDIAQNARHGDKISGQAIKQATAASHVVTLLDESSSKIDDITAVLKRIADQTNLLALNATIEAASAGDAGKGFTVVAKEIKELANQSALSADDIAERIEAVRENTQKAVTTIAEAVDTIGHFSQSVGIITQSVEQQTHASADIAYNVQQVNTGTSDIATSITELSKNALDMARVIGQAANVVNEVTINIKSVSQSAGRANDDSHKVKASAGELSNIAHQLQAVVQKFKINASMNT
jgi:methyl-accepting chemotaxis protein